MAYAFCTVDADIFDRAAEIALATCKKYPEEPEMWDFINQAAEQGNNEPVQIEPLPPTPPTPKKVPNMFKNLNGLQNNRVGKSRQVCGSGAVFQNFYRRR